VTLPISVDDHEELVALAYKDADAALARTELPLSMEAAAPADLSRLHRIRSVALRLKGRFQPALEEAVVAEELARDHVVEDVLVPALLDQGAALTLMGSMEEAEARIDEAANLARDRHSSALCRFQRGFLRLLEGRLREARPEFEEAARGFELEDDLLNLRKTLQNLGGICVELGDVEAAAVAQERAYEIARRSSDLYAMEGINQHRGRLASYQGDLPRALSILEEADRIDEQITGSPVPRHVTRAEVLTSAGLFGEARELASRIAQRNMDKGDLEHAGNAWLIASRAALFDGDPGAASELARQAESVLSESGRSLAVSEAKLLALEAEVQSGQLEESTGEELGEILTELEKAGRSYSVAEGRLLAGRVNMAAGDDGKAIANLRPLAEERTGPVEMRLFSALARAWIALLDGDERRAAVAARTGLDALDRVQEALGATDLRMGVEKHSRELGEVALRVAVDSGRPRRILRWMERTRARSLRYTPSGLRDPDSDRISTELRRIDHALREGGGSQHDLMSERRRLQDQLARRHRRVRRERGKEPDRFDIDDLVERLGDKTLVELAGSGGTLHAVVVSAGRARDYELASTESIVRELGHVRFSMRRAARLGREFDRTTLRSLDDAIFGEIALDEPEIVLVPPPELMALPWAALPSLSRCQAVISPSAEMWWRSDRKEGLARERVVVAGGPDLETAHQEVRRVAALYDAPVVLRPGATVERVKDELDGSDVAHVAAHAHFEPHNPMFSALRLGDGDLSVYDIQRLENPPRAVVLSACDSGYSEARAGEELAGLTSALLSMGTRDIVASVGLVPDAQTTADLMVDFHEGLIAGREPAEALSQAQAKAFQDPERFVSAASFICVGA
jgi:tetratricopeptide (TPR) repeat protein